MARQRSNDKQLPPVLDLFSGAGGLSLGFSKAGFRVPYALDSWDVACETHDLNHPQSETICGDLAAVPDAELLERFGDARVVIGGPPCQGFSSAGKQLLDDPRNRLVEEFLRVVQVLEPEAFLFENVKGLATRSGGQLVAELEVRFKDLGYTTAHQLLSATDYGIPQKRQRFMMMGLKSGVPEFPAPTHQYSTREQIQFLEECPTFNEAVSDLPVIAAGEESTSYAKGPANHFQSLMRQDSETLTLHKAPNHRPHMIQLMSFIPQGRSAFELADSIPTSLMPKSGFPNSYARLREDEPGPTVTRNFTTPSSANCIHPNVNRALTLREGARLQTFPDSYRFAGNFGDVRLQIGNAVPPMLAQVVATSMAAALKKSDAVAA